MVRKLGVGTAGTQVIKFMIARIFFFFLIISGFKLKIFLWRSKSATEPQVENYFSNSKKENWKLDNVNARASLDPQF